MTGQLPQPRAVFLDHIAHFVPAMDAAAQALERCGFRLTPFTAQTNRVDGNPIPAGTGNRCVMFRRGYLEILAATADTPLAQQLTERLARHVGLHLAAFGTADAAFERQRLAASGFPVLPLVDMRRPVTTERGEEWARFTIARIADGIMPEGRMQFLTHHTEELVWREPYLDHPNGARSLRSVWIAATDPAEAVQRFARFTGRPVRQEARSRRSRSSAGPCGSRPPNFSNGNSALSPDRRSLTWLPTRSRSRASRGCMSTSPRPSWPRCQFAVVLLCGLHPRSAVRSSLDAQRSEHFRCWPSPMASYIVAWVFPAKERRVDDGEASDW